MEAQRAVRALPDEDSNSLCSPTTPNGFYYRVVGFNGAPPHVSGATEPTIGLRRRGTVHQSDGGIIWQCVHPFARDNTRSSGVPSGRVRCRWNCRTAWRSISVFPGSDRTENSSPPGIPSGLILIPVTVRPTVPNGFGTPWRRAVSRAPPSRFGTPRRRTEHRWLRPHDGGLALCRAVSDYDFVSSFGTSDGSCDAHGPGRQSISRCGSA
jgi:hypothetical protein